MTTPIIQNKMKQLLIFFAALLSLTASAQNYVGSWEVFPNYGTPTTIVETPEYVYTLAGSSLCGYDKSTGEVIAYNTSHKLNGNLVSGIWYDPEEKYLFVAYTDYNIDLVYDDGRTINVPDLRDAAISNDKKINQVAFSEGKAYVALNSGMLVIDPQHGAVIESCIWGKQVNLIAVSSKHIFVYYSGGDRWYYSPKNVSHHNLEKSFMRCPNSGAYASNGIVSANGITALIGSDKKLYTLNVNDEATDSETVLTSTKGYSATSSLDAQSLQVTASGISASGNGTVYLLNKDGELTTITAAESKGNKVATWDGKTLWLADATGYGQYDLASSSFKVARTKPNSTSGSNVGIFKQTPDGTIYLSTVGVHHTPAAYNISYGKNTYLDLYKNGNISASPVALEKSLCDFEFLPGSNDELVASYFTLGASKINLTDKTTYKYTTDNTNFDSNWLVRDVKIDSDGSLWFLQRLLNSPYTNYLIKAKPGSWETETNPNEWSKIELPDIGQNHSNRIVIDEAKRNIIVSGNDNGIAIIKMPAANENLGPNTKIAYNDLTYDEDGMSMSAWKYPSLVVDKTGWVWIASDTGIRIIRNSDEAFSAGYAPMRPKVARNDGTNLADYLLDQVEVFNIHVDENNQKWISTIGSGLYRVSADGSEILDHFTTENSKLPSDNVFAAHADRNSNKIFIGTDQGLCIYHSTTSAAAPDYNDVYAYPNPVTPDYTGWITVTGLMDGSLVKIADAAGRVFYQGKSDGGMITWNGCDASGRRVKSGVYFVFASKSEEGSSSGAAVTKIVVVN